MEKYTNSTNVLIIRSLTLEHILHSEKHVNKKGILCQRIGIKKYFKGTNVCQYDKMYCIRYNGGRYEIQKWCREEQTIYFYGSFSTLTDACDGRDCLIRADWDWDTLCDLSIGVY